MTNTQIRGALMDAFHGALPADMRLDPEQRTLVIGTLLGIAASVMLVGSERKVTDQHVGEMIRAASRAMIIHLEMIGENTEGRA